MDNIQIIGTKTQELLSHLKVVAKVAVSETNENEEKIYNVEISGEDLGILIGYHGDTLYHIQHLLSLIVNRNTENYIRIVVDVDGWREERKTVIHKMVDHAIQKLHLSHQSQVLPPMTAYERRLIHSYIAEQEDVTSHSEGEANSRKVIIEFKSQQ